MRTNKRKTVFKELQLKKIDSFDKIKNDLTLQKLEIMQGLEEESQKQNRDEWTFLIVLYAVFSLIYLMLVHPKTHFLTFFRVVMPAQLVFRHIYYIFLDPQKKAFFLTDLCYFVTYMLLYWITYGHQDEEMLRNMFVLGNGVLAVSLFAFGNELVFHEIDNMASFAIHCFPMLISIVIRWYVIPAEAELPAEERMFCQITQEEIFGEYFWRTMFINNLKIYI